MEELTSSLLSAPFEEDSLLQLQSSLNAYKLIFQSILSVKYFSLNHIYNPIKFDILFRPNIQTQNIDQY